MKRFLKSFRHGQRGFTLIELLVVIAILGVLAAIIIPNIAGFIGTGTVQAANTEAHDVQLAVTACMVENNWSTCSGTVGPGHTSLIKSGLTPPVVGTEPEAYFTGNLQATYTILDSAITDATATVGGKWADLVYTAGTGWAKPAP